MEQAVFSREEISRIGADECQGNRFIMLPVGELSEIEREPVRQFLRAHISSVSPWHGDRGHPVTRSFEDQDGLSAREIKVLTDIHTHGWHVIGVLADGGEKGPEWAYSVGLFHTLGHPELVVSGLKLKTCMNLVYEIGKQVKSGKRFETRATTMES